MDKNIRKRPPTLDEWRYMRKRRLLIELRTQRALAKNANEAIARLLLQAEEEGISLDE